jgi:hypothetical protein
MDKDREIQEMGWKVDTQTQGKQEGGGFMCGQGFYM